MAWKINQEVEHQHMAWFKEEEQKQKEGWLGSLARVIVRNKG
jgi:hypothetical protein